MTTRREIKSYEYDAEGRIVKVESWELTAKTIWIPPKPPLKKRPDSEVGSSKSPPRTMKRGPRR